MLKIELTFAYYCCLFLVIAFLLGCGDSLNISGITETDETGYQPIGNVDENDWCVDSQSAGALYPAYPNPASEQVSIRFDLRRAILVKLQIINEDKRIIRVLVDGIHQAGIHVFRWDF